MASQSFQAYLDKVAMELYHWFFFRWEGRFEVQELPGRAQLALSRLDGLALVKGSEVPAAEMDDESFVPRP